MSESGGSVAGRTDIDEATFLDLRDYAAVLWDAKWLIAGITALAVIAGAVLSLMWPSRYESRATILLPDPDETEVSGQTEEALALSLPVVGLAADRLGSLTAPQLLERVTAEIAANTQLLEITYQSEDPIEAQRGARITAQAYLDFRGRLASQPKVEELERQIEGLSIELTALTRELGQTLNVPLQPEPRRIIVEARIDALAAQIAELEAELARVRATSQALVGTVVGAPLVPRQPSGPGTVATTVASVLAGLILGGMVAFIRERTGDRLRSAADLEFAAGAPVLAVIPSTPASADGSRPSIVALSDPGSPGSEAYRTLRATVESVVAQRRLGTLLVTSASTAEGRSALVSNLAVLLAQGGARVIVVSADFRRPEVHRYFGLSNKTGLSNVLAGRKGPDSVMSKTKVPGLLVIPSGPPPKVSGDLLGSPAMSKVLSALEGSADLILIDAPPILDGADAVVLAARADGVLLVAGVLASKRAAVTMARQRLDQVDANLVGTVLTEARRRALLGAAGR